MLIVDPERRTVEWLAEPADGYRPVERSGTIALAASELADRLRWPERD